MTGPNGKDRPRMFLAQLSFWVFSVSGALTSLLGWVIAEDRMDLKGRFWEWPPGKFALATVALSLLAGLPASILGWYWCERGSPRRAAVTCATPPLLAATVFAVYDVTAVNGFLIAGGPLIACALWSALRASPRRWKTAATIVLVAAGLLGANGALLFVEGALVRAAGSGHLETASIILESGFDVEARNRQGGSPLMAAVEADDAEMVLLLLDWEASPYRRDASGDSPMLRSIELRTTELTVLMLGDFEVAEPTPYYDVEEIRGPSV